MLSLAAACLSVPRKAWLVKNDAVQTGVQHTLLVPSPSPDAWKADMPHIPAPDPDPIDDSLGPYTQNHATPNTTATVMNTTNQTQRWALSRPINEHVLN